MIDISSTIDSKPFYADDAPCMLLRVSPCGELLQANHAFVEYMGGAIDEADELAWAGRLSNKSHAEMVHALSLRCSFSLTLCFEMGSGQGAGTPSWLECVAKWQGGLGYYLCVWHDVSVIRQAEAISRSRADQFQLWIENLPASLAYFDVGTMRCLFANKLYAQTFGWDEAAIIGRSVSEIVGVPATEVVLPYLERALQEKRAVSYEREVIVGNGESRWIDVSLWPHLGATGDPVAMLVLILDATKHRLSEQALRESEERFATFMQASAERVVFHKNNIIVDVNGSVCELFGYTPEMLVGRETLEFVAPDQIPVVVNVIALDQDVTYESAVIHKDGRRLPVEFISRSLLRNGEHVRMTIVRDLRSRRAEQEHIRYLAHHDAMTGLPNRMKLMEQLGHLIVGARLAESQLALLFIDLDRFKRVNDSLGHLVGDTLLQTVARRITEALRTTDVVARFGGDEFVVLLPSILQRGDVEEVAHKLLAAIEVPVNADGRLISVTPSIGISMFPEHGETADVLIKNADMAMYLAKSRGRANFQFFTQEMARSAYEALVLESQLTQALVHGEFVLHFQPQVRARDGVMVGAEVLIRWNHPERGLLLPDSFITLAEEQRQMLQIGQWVLREAARYAVRWRAAGLTDVRVAVNLSSIQFQTSGFTALIEQLLREEGASGHLLELELTERMLMDDLPEVKRKLSELKELGFHISVDDFGTGYSSLCHLKELPINKLKIDRSFVRDLPGERGSTAIAHAIIQMARGLNLTVIAEGVETDAQRDFLANAGCDELQGMLISPPLALADFEAWATKNAATRS